MATTQTLKRHTNSTDAFTTDAEHVSNPNLSILFEEKHSDNWKMKQTKEPNTYAPYAEFNCYERMRIFKTNLK